MGIFQSITDGLGITRFGEQEAAMGRGLAEFAGLGLPDIPDVELQRMVSAGTITPEFAEIIKLERNAYKDIYVDPRLKQQQMKTLEGVQEIAETGMTAEDRADLARIAAEESQAERGAREAIIQQAQMRGVSGSGLELAQQLASQQGSATRRSARDVEVAGQAAQRRIAALEQAGQLAGQLRGQEYAEQADVARAQQLIEQFNVQNTQQQLAQRAAAKNVAQEANLRAAQDIMNQNVAIANQEALYRASLPQQQYQNALNLASAKAGGQYQMANMYGQQSQAGLGGAGGFASAAAILAASDEDVKEDVKMNPEAIDSFLEDLTGYSFRYKPEYIKEGIGSEGNKIGVMAQDMEDILPKSVEELEKDEESIKMLNNNEILPAVLASVGRLNDRLKEVEDKDGK